MFREFIQYYKPHKKVFIQDLMAAFLVAVIDLVYPVVTRNMLNVYIPNQMLNALLTSTAVLLILYLVKMGMNYFMQYYGHLVGVGMQADMRRDVFQHLQKLPYSFFDEHKTGSIMSRIINDLMDVSELAHHGPEDLFISAIMLIGSFAYLCTINVLLTVLVFAFLPFLIWFSMKKRIKMSKAFTETRVQVAEVNATLENSISGVRVSKAFDNGAHEVEKFQDSNRKFVTARSHAYKAMAEFSSGTTFIIDLLNVVVLVLGGLFTFQGIISLGDFVAYMLFISMFLNPIRKLISFVEQLQQGMTGFKRFHELIHAEPEHDSEKGTDLENVKGKIQFENVSFAYDQESEDGAVLNDINITIEPGKTVALVGPSGGGKTTLCHLVPRFYELTGGRILLDGVDVKDVSFSSLRRNIGIVQQDVFLFTGTIKENIAYGRLDATDEEIIEAAKRANIHDYVTTLPEGYDTYIGERGVKLSGGQKQRISIARVFLKNPQILILDEATSALDNATEVMIQNALEELAHGRTSMIVAHRLSTIKNADEIIVLTREGVQERGTHEELMEKKGIYFGLYQAQFKNLTDAVGNKVMG